MKPQQQEPQSKHDRYIFLKEQLSNVPVEISKLETQAKIFQQELNELLTDHISEIAEPWNATSTVKGHPIHLDRKGRKLVLQVSESDYVLIDIEHLRSVDAIEAAKRLENYFAQSLAKPEPSYFPCAIGNSGVLTIEPSGHCDYQPSQFMPWQKPFQKVRPQESTEPKGHSAMDATGKILTW